MKRLIPMVALIICFTLVGSACGQTGEKSYPYKVGFFWDGGTFYIKDKASRGGEGSFCFDYRLETKTTGEFFGGGVHPTDKGAKMLSSKNALLAFATIEKKLRDYYGDEEFDSILADVEKILARRMEMFDVKDREMAYTRLIITRFALYRSKLKAEQAGTGQPSTRTESKSEGGDKPQPESEGRSR